VFGEIEELRERAAERLRELESRGIEDAMLYDARDSSVGGTHAMFVFRGRPDEYNLPARPDVPTVHLRSGWTSAAIAAVLMVVGTVTAFAVPRE
jgi:formate dehydrogenase iron-sulfur subunit